MDAAKSKCRSMSPLWTALQGKIESEPGTRKLPCSSCDDGAKDEDPDDTKARSTTQ